MEPEPKKRSAIEFVKHKLSLNPEASYADIKAMARFEGVPVYPVVYGRAKALLGLVPTAPYGSKSKTRQRKVEEKAAREKAQVVEPPTEIPAPTRSMPVDPRNGDSEVATRTVRARAIAASEAAEDLGSLAGMLKNLKQAVEERDRYEAALRRIAGLIRTELGE